MKKKSLKVYGINSDKEYIQTKKWDLLVVIPKAGKRDLINLITWIIHTNVVTSILLFMY